MTVNGIKWALVAIIGLFSIAAAGCDEIEEAAENIVQDAVGGEAAALEDDEMPNCSRVINCCARLATGEHGEIIPDAVHTECSDTISPAADVVISEYQRERSVITNNSTITEATRTETLNDLRDEWQDRVEPGCRCFLEETVGQIPSIVIPPDCEHFTEVGALEPPLECSDATTALIDVAGSL